jgi:hypothetical protein
MSGTGQLDTNLNQTPYVNDYDAKKQYYYTLFKPSTAVQIRELNSLQSTFYNQIYRLGQNLFVSGTIIQGCNITTNQNIQYVKLADTYANGAALNVSDIVGFGVTSNSGLTGIVTYATSGYLSTAPNLNTIYVGYLNSAVNSTTNSVIQVFQNDEVLNVINISSNVIIGQITVANTITSGASNTTGKGYTLSVDDGVIFQKGMMLEVANQTIIVAAYNNMPNNISVGFSSIESVVTAYQDQTLFDNAQTSPNLNAPGADRLKLVPTLIMIASDTANSQTNNFFSICDFVNGSPSVVNQETQYSVIGQKMAEISNDTNGSFIINPFNVALKQIYFANNLLDTSNMRLEINAGEAYVNGNKVNIQGQLLGVMKKGIDTNQLNSQILTAQFGNYVVVDELAGIFDPTAVQSVSFRDTAAYAVSNSLVKGIGPNSLAAPGNELGTARIYGVQYIYGTESAPTGKYYIYFDHIIMANSTGGRFDNVKSLYSNTGGVIGIADVVLENSIAVIHDSTFKTKVYPYNQKAIKTLKTAANTVDTQFEFRSKSVVTFATTGNVTITVPSYIGGNNSLPYGTGVLNIPTMSSDILVITEANVHSANIAGSLTVGAASLIVNGTLTSFVGANNVGVSSFITLANTTATETRQIANIANNTQLTTTLPFTNTWTAANAYITYLAGDPLPLAAANAVVNVVNSTAFTITLPTSLSATCSATVFYNVIRTVAYPANKSYQTKIYALIDGSNNAGGISGPWCLGIPDIVSVSNVWIGTSYSNANPSYLSSFTLDNGQRDSVYGPGYLQSNGGVINSTSKALVEFQCFIPNYSTSQGFFTVDSYPVDDTGVTANSIYTYQIPYYISSQQNLINLRNAIDFRAYTQNTIPYVGNVALAIANTQIINPNSAFNYNTTNYYSPLPNAIIESSLQYYMGRYDTVGLSNNGTIIVKSGIPAERPIPPGDVSAGITLGTVHVRPYPTITSDQNIPFTVTTPTVTVDYKANRRYTMADIAKLDSRITEVEYYTSLSVLEQSAQNLLLTNAAGQNRFQSGILVDPMDDFSIANTSDPSFNIAIDSENSVARPTFSQSLIDLAYLDDAAGILVTNNNRLIMLNYTEANPGFIIQPFGSNQRNCAQDTVYVYHGIVDLTPEGDYIPDVTTNPSVVIDSPAYSNFQTLTNGWTTQWGTWNETTKVSLTSKTNDYSFGDVVTNVSLQPYCRPLNLLFQANGLKPNSQVWPFFNDVNVSGYCTSVIPNTIGAVDVNNFNIDGINYVVGSQTLITDVTGSLNGFFQIPFDTFHSGTINFQLLDITNLATQSNVISTIATTRYYGTNLAYTQNNLTLETSTPQLAIDIVSSTINSDVINTLGGSSGIGNINQGNQGGGGHAGADPIAQSFLINAQSLPSGVEGVYATSLILYFASKDANLGVRVHLQPLSNGTIQEVVVPLSRVHLTSAQVNISTDSSLPTQVTFPAPVFLAAGQEYAFVVIPDGANPNYKIWTARIGDNDIISSSPIFGFSTVGVMFTSSNKVTWTPYQNENIKFKLKIANFTSSTAVANLVNKAYEYLGVNNQIGNYLAGEVVRIGNTTIGTCNVGNNVSLVTNVSTAGLTNTSVVGIISTTNAKAFVSHVSTVVNSTSYTTTTPCTFTDNNAKAVLLNTIKGNVKYSNTSLLVLHQTNVTTGLYLLNNTAYYAIGVKSGAFTNNALLQNIPYDTMMPKLSVSLPATSTLTYNMIGCSNTNVIDVNLIPLTFGYETDFYDQERVVLSISNEAQYLAGKKSLTIQVGFNSLTSYLSPVLDKVKLGAQSIYNIVNADAANQYIYTSEISNYGNAINKYISTTVTLASGLESEDLVVYLGAYNPPGTDIYVYAKMMNQYDSDAFYNKPWTPLTTNNSYQSSLINTQDVAEYQYNIPTSNATPLTAYIDTTNNNVVTYYSANGQQFTTFNTFAIKIVLLSNTSQIIPEITDFRALCVAASN